MQKYKEAAIKELKKIRDKITNQVEERTIEQRQFLNSTITHMLYILENGHEGIWIVKNQEGEDTAFSYLDAVNILEKVNDLSEYHQNMNIVLTERDMRIKSYIQNKIMDCFFPYIAEMYDCSLRIKQEKLQSLDYLTEPEEVSEEVKVACEKESERLLRVAEEKRRANR